MANKGGHMLVVLKRLLNRMQGNPRIRNLGYLPCMYTVGSGASTHYRVIKHKTRCTELIGLPLPLNPAGSRVGAAPCRGSDIYGKGESTRVSLLVNLLVLVTPDDKDRALDLHKIY